MFIKEILTPDGSNRDDSVCKGRGVSCWRGQNYVVSLVIPRSITNDVSIKLRFVSDENTKFFVGDEFIQKGLGAYEASHNSTVCNVDPHDDGERPQHIGTYELQQRHHQRHYQRHH